MQKLEGAVTHINHHPEVQILAGSNQLKVLPKEPYSPIVLDFLNDLSKELRKYDREHPDIAALAFWCRRGNLIQLKNQHKDLYPRLGQGLVFHIAPSNVPINFAFSYLFGLLAGNSNVVRLPSRSHPQVSLICDILSDLYSKPEYLEIFQTSALVRYPIDDEITSYFSNLCDARVIWGGDETVLHLKSLPSSPRTIDLAFSDRFSTCLLDGESINQLDDAGIHNLAEGFFNDTFLMDQNACSSPHIILWIGPDIDSAQKRFWKQVKKVVEKKYQLEAIQNIDKYTLLCKNLILGPDGQKASLESPFIYRVSLSQLPDPADQLRGLFGLFYEFQSESLEDPTPLLTLANKKLQTITYFGLDPQMLANRIVEGRVIGVDRIVPVGKALDIGLYWDGYDVIRSLSRIIFVQ